MKDDPEKARQRTAIWRKKNPRQARAGQLWAKFRLRLEKYEELLKQQQGVCAICNHICMSGRQLAVDHCHINGQIRGLLCMHCNQGLGHFKDDVILLQKAIEYLNKRKYG